MTAHAVRSDGSLVGSGGFNLPYPAGTRTHMLTFTRGEQQLSYDDIINEALYTWELQYGKTRRDDLFITISHVGLKVLVEVSDRLREVR